MRSFFAGVKAEIRQNPTIFLVKSLLILSVGSVMIRSILVSRFENAFLCILTIGLFFLPDLIGRKFHLEYPTGLELFILVFIFASEILGEIASFYTKLPFWDILLHTTSGFLFAAIGFAVVDLLNRNEKIKFSLSPSYLALFAFCFGVTIGTLWEFFECSMDLLFKKDMQKDTIVSFLYSVSLDPNGGNEVVVKEGIKDVILVYENGQESLGLGGYLDVGIYDTMEDMLVNLVGATVFSVIGYRFFASGEGIAKQFIPTLSEEESK